MDFGSLPNHPYNISLMFEDTAVDVSCGDNIRVLIGSHMLFSRICYVNAPYLCNDTTAINR